MNLSIKKLRILSRVPVLCSAYVLINDSDIVSTDSDTVKNADIGKVEETGKDRLKRMFSLDEHDNMSPELASILQVACMSTFIGALYGGMLNSRNAYSDFIKNNQATAFKDHLEAKKKLQDKVTLSFAKGAFRWGWRLSLFSTTYMTVSTVISVYRGKFGIIEHLAAGTTAGIAYKFQVGPKGWIVGGVLGCVLGAIAGSFTYGILSATGLSMEEVRYWQYRWKESRTNQFREAVEKQKEKDELFILHNMKIGDDGKNIDNLEQK